MRINKNLPVENLVKDIARQPNEFTDAIFRGSAMAYKLIIYALYRIVNQPNPIEPTKKNVYCGFSRNEFCERMGISIGSNTLSLIEKATEELSGSFLILRNETARNESDIYSLKMPWFQKVETMLNGDVNLKFNQEIADFFDFKIGYTALELLEIGNLQSFYAMRYYGFAKSKQGFSGTNGNKKNTWWFEYTEDELRNLFDIGKSKYKIRKDFAKYVIKAPCEEVNEKTNIHIDLEYTKLGKGKYLWRFVCSEKTEQLKILKSDTKASKNEKRELNEELRKVARLKEQHPARWQEVYDFEMTQPCLFGDGNVKQIFAENKANMALLQEFGETSSLLASEVVKG